MKPKHAPGFQGGKAWLNVDEPIRLEQLRGCVVIVDFWTYCCVNCMHVLPVLRALEERYADEPLVVIGVHSGKFAAERDPEHIREAVGRYGVPHPVVVDDDFAIWSRFDIRSWPTLVVVRPDGTIAAVAPGEPDLETLDAFVRQELDQAREQGTLAQCPPPIHCDAAPVQNPLRYPGRAVVLPDGRMAISDSGHHRVLLCDLDGTVQATIGSGLRGWQDGEFEQVAFDDPQGLYWHDGFLYIADTRNHAIRRADLADWTVTTPAGTGVLGDEATADTAPATETALRSPWDLCSVGDKIYVAMAGSHQIWLLDPAKETIAVYAGTGVEALLDGPVQRSSWAQPSGLSERDGTLYVADSETSAVRAIDLETGVVSTLVGQGLFDFGDEDGEADAALLQHCMDVEATHTGVLIADTYNGKIKQLRSATRQEPARLRTVLTGLSEPGSVSAAPDGSWIIADTNAHRIVRLNKGQLDEITIRGAPEPCVGALRPVGAAQPPSEGVQGWYTTLLELEPGTGLKAGDGSLLLVLRAPPGTEISEGAPLHTRVEVSRRSDLLFADQAEASTAARGGTTQLVNIDVRVTAVPDPEIEAELLATVRFVACNATNRAACYPGTVHLRVPVRLLAENGARQLEFEVDLPSPTPAEQG